MRWVGRRAGELGYALTDAPVCLAGAVLFLVTFGVGLALSPLLVGVPIVAAAVAGAGSWGRFERARAARLLGERTASPPERRSMLRLTDWLRLVLADPNGWRAALYVVVRVPLAVVTTVLAVAMYGGAGGALSYPLWFRHSPIVFGVQQLNTPDRVAAVAAVGLLLLAAGPLLLRAPITVSRWTVRLLLTPTRPSRRVRALEQARGQVLAASAEALRRIERDLHDGTQARLATLAMDVGLARELASSGDRATLERTLQAAHRNALQAMRELRHIVAGIHPPQLDAGLATALQSLADDLAVPVELRVEQARRPSPAIETIVYYCIAELLANVVKHSGATSCRVEVRAGTRTVEISVTDDGAGGADPAGAGLSGLAERLAAVDGSLAVDSPSGGPTAVTVRLPATI